LQKFKRAKLILLVGLRVQASARSPAVLIFILTGVDVGGLVGAAAYVSDAKTTVKKKIRTNRIVHLFLLLRRTGRAPGRGIVPGAKVPLLRGPGRRGIMLCPSLAKEEARL
jgi:hypothetical protein